MDNKKQNNDQASKKILPPNVNQMSIKEYEELRKKELTALAKKKQKTSSPLRLVGKALSFLAGALGLFIIGYMGFVFITTLFQKP
jgi:hypothetical protein